jgi:glycosyltransferase involved in cell wall biosynthesis
MFVADLVARSNGAFEHRVVALRDGDDERLEFAAPTSVLGIRPSRLLRMELRGILRLRRSIKAAHASVVHAHGGEALKYALPAAAGTGAKVVYRRIGSTPPGSAGRLQLSGHRRLVLRASAVVAVSQATWHEVVDGLGVPKSRAFLIPNAVDVSRARPARGRAEVRRSLGVGENDEVVVSVGAFHPEKDPLGQVALFARVARMRPSAIFLMVGSGSLEPEVRRSLATRRLDDRVRLLGSRDDVADILGAADVLLLASRSEGMPAVAIEAGIARTPVAGYALAGIPEVVVDGVTGLLAPPGDAHQLAACVVQVLSDEVLRVRLGRAANERCVNEFGIEAIAARYTDLYRSLTDHNVNRLEPARL